MTLPRSYDQWRLSSPWEDDPEPCECGEDDCTCLEDEADELGDWLYEQRRDETLRRRYGR